MHHCISNKTSCKRERRVLLRPCNLQSEKFQISSLASEMIIRELARSLAVFRIKTFNGFFVTCRWASPWNHCWAMEFYNQEIVDNIKHEEEGQFVVVLTDVLEPVLPDNTQSTIDVRDFRINLKRFDKNWSSNAKLFTSYSACGECLFVSRDKRGLWQHLASHKHKKFTL